MIKYITPVISAFSGDEVDEIITYALCDSRAPTYGCQSKNTGEWCNDGSVASANCESNSTWCPSSQSMNTLCPTSSEDYCTSNTYNAGISCTSSV